jgi:prephenate dehydratase
VAFLREDHPGALMELLTEFAVRGINLTRIESRPTGDGLC